MSAVTRPPLIGCLWLGVLLSLLPGPAAAQAPGLDRVDSLLAAGQYDVARSTLEQWWSAREAFDVPGSDRVRAMMLRARLQTDPAAAETDYLGVIIGHPTSPHAPEALLRLGQSLLVSGQAARAAGYLQRLAADYPGRPQRTLGMLWLARAQNAARHPVAACRAAREGLADAGAHPDLAAMLRIEEAAACAIASSARTPPGETAEQRPEQPEPRRAPAEPIAAAPTGDYAVQSGAFRFREGADALLARLRNAGFDARAVVVPRNALLRIRVGRFTSAAEAAEVMRAMKRAGFDAVVVSDAAQERSP
ncbi:MAG: SPOR domain-containing protein [Gemmatimonadetes bacterium]|nr:SPOR domain-containing protein [Gemmatimonadota bacterium]